MSLDVRLHSGDALLSFPAFIPRCTRHKKSQFTTRQHSYTTSFRYSCRQEDVRYHCIHMEPDDQGFAGVEVAVLDIVDVEVPDADDGAAVVVAFNATVLVVP